MCLVWYGCATVFNDSVQDVPVKVPHGTTISYYNGAQIPLRKEVIDGDTITHIRLKRKTNHTLRFAYRDRDAMITIPRSIDGGWIGADAFFLVYPLIVDAVTGAWFSFEGVEVHFSDDTAVYRPTVTPYEPSKLLKDKIGVVAIATMGHTWPSNFDFPFVSQFLFGVGYEFSDRFSLIAEWNFANDIDFLPTHTPYVYDHSDLSTYQLQARYQFTPGLYAAAGGGIGIASVDHIWYLDDDRIRHLFGGVTHTFPTVFGALGYAGETGFVELRHTQGIGDFRFPNGVAFDPGMTSFNFGFHFHF